jgi:hypothetical protein
MAQRITIILADEVISKLRTTQAELITKLNRSVSLSSVINQILKENL